MVSAFPPGNPHPPTPSAACSRLNRFDSFAIIFHFSLSYELSASFTSSVGSEHESRFYLFSLRKVAVELNASLDLIFIWQ